VQETVLLRSILATALVVATTAASHAAANGQITPPAVPANLQVPAEYKPFLIAQAIGTQNYICLPSGPGFAWTFFGPQATLFGDDLDQVMTHYLSPNPVEAGTPRATWRHSRDSSTVWAVAVESSTDPDFVAPGAIPWLKLQVVGAQFGPEFGHRLTPAAFIQRVATAGGIAPASGCAGAADVGKKALVPYTTDYVFYKDRTASRP